MTNIIEIVEKSTPDKNGTVTVCAKVECTKCGGKGSSTLWSHTGSVCYTCQGKGYILNTFKEYTEAYQKVLDERKAAKMVNNPNHIDHPSMASYMQAVTTNEKIYIATEFIPKEDSRFKYNPRIGAYATSPVDGVNTVEVETNTMYYVNSVGIVSVMPFVWYGVKTRGKKDLNAVKSRGFRFQGSELKWYTISKTLADEVARELGVKVTRSLKNARMDDLEAVERITSVVNFCKYNPNIDCIWQEMLPNALASGEKLQLW